MYSLSDITGTLVLDWIQRDSIGRFDALEIDANKTNRGVLSVAALAIDAFTEAATNCGLDLEGLTTTQTAYVNGSLLWKIAADLAFEEMSLGKNCEDCETKHSDFRELACIKADEALRKVSFCMSNLLGLNCGTEDDLPDIFSFYSESNCDCGECQ